MPTPYPESLLPGHWHIFSGSRKLSIDEEGGNHELSIPDGDDPVSTYGRLHAMAHLRFAANYPDPPNARAARVLPAIETARVMILAQARGVDLSQFDVAPAATGTQAIIQDMEKERLILTWMGAEGLPQLRAALESQLETRTKGLAKRYVRRMFNTMRQTREALARDPTPAVVKKHVSRLARFLEEPEEKEQPAPPPKQQVPAGMPLEKMLPPRPTESGESGSKPSPDSSPSSPPEEEDGQPEQDEPDAEDEQPGQGEGGAGDTEPEEEEDSDEWGEYEWDEDESEDEMPKVPEPVLRPLPSVPQAAPKPQFDMVGDADAFGNLVHVSSLLKDFTPGTNYHWSPMTVEKHPLTERQVRSALAETRTQAPGDLGSVPRYMHRYCSDQAVFASQSRRADVPVVLIDVSGSMGLQTKQIDEFVKLLPECKIAMYSGKQDHGKLHILADGARRVSEIPEPLGGNFVDGPALEWLGSQKGMRIWVSDGQVTGNVVYDNYGYKQQMALFHEYFVRQAQAIIRRYDIMWVKSLPECRRLFDSILIRRQVEQGRYYR